MRQITKIFWFFLAAFFLIEAWLWDNVGAALRRLADAIPLAALKAAIARGLEKLPAPLALVAFIVPVILLEPLKVVAIWLMGAHHFILGVLTFAFAEIFTVGVIAFIFDVLRGKLLSMAWFAKLYDIVLKVRAWADEIVAPYKVKIRESMASMRRWIHEKLAAHEQGPFMRRLMALREQVRRRRSV